jgi:hypothetical protein
LGTGVADHAELGEDDRALGAAVEALDLAVGHWTTTMLPLTYSWNAVTVTGRHRR